MRTAGLAVLLVPLTACGGMPFGSGSGPPAGRTYLSVSSSRPLVDGTRIELSFEDGKVIASGGCNVISGPVRIERDRLVGDEIGMTLMACEDGTSEQDHWLAALLQADPAYTVDGDRLRLTSGGETLELVDREVADPDRPLTGTRWRLVTIYDDEVAGPVPGGAAADVRFDSGRVVASVSGCNVAEGPAEVDGDRIRLGRMVHTSVACQGGAAEVERAVVAVLEGTIEYEIEGPALELEHPSGKGLGLRAD